MKMREFYILNELSNIFKINDKLEALPIIWNRNGEYCIIPAAVIENAVDVMSMYIVSGGKRTKPTPVILWSQGIPINNLAGRALVGE